jgi:dihydrofolate synthase/folylpolyglutamate synthase
LRFENLAQWLDWQANLHPREIDLGLARVKTVWQRLQPETLQAHVVTVAGTNGKGSTVAMLESICLQAGIPVGSFTSPHLIRYNERIRLNAEPVTDQQLCQAFERIDQLREGISLSYFEFATLAALLCFAAEKPDIVILEVGLGGRLDAVNIIDADIAMITTIGLDHTDWLGSDIGSIGREKAGIIRSHKPVVLADPEMPASVLDHAHLLEADIYLADEAFHYQKSESGWHWSGPDGVGLELPFPALAGDRQLMNASAVVMACQLLAQHYPLEKEVIAKGLVEVRLAGRLHFVAGSPALLLDVAHNRQSLETLQDALSRLNWQGQIHAVFGLLRDKNAADAVQLIGPWLASWHLLDVNGWRGREAGELACALREEGVGEPISCHHTFTEAFQVCSEKAEPQDLILIFGSFLIVGEAMHKLNL